MCLEFYSSRCPIVGQKLGLSFLVERKLKCWLISHSVFFSIFVYCTFLQHLFIYLRSLDTAFNFKRPDNSTLKERSLKERTRLCALATTFEAIKCGWPTKNITRKEGFSLTTILSWRWFFPSSGKTLLLKGPVQQFKQQVKLSESVIKYRDNHSLLSDYLFRNRKERSQLENCATSSKHWNISVGFCRIRW